ncbi:MAG: hypothetical protein PHC53_05815 [Patescibacteria group bacterium]|nr:hypothetical protein [Patescibacteria group bacterium]
MLREEKMGSTDTSQNDLPPTAPADTLTLCAYEIPERLYIEICGQLTIGPEKLIVLSPSEAYMGRRLDPNRKETGFEGCIGFRSQYDLAELVLWSRFPEPNSASAVLRIVATFDSASGKGGWKTEAKLDHNLKADDPAVILSALILMRMRKLHLDPCPILPAIRDGRPH